MARLAVGVLLLPVCFAATRAAFFLVRSIQPSSASIMPPPAWALAGGFLAWLLLYFTLPRPLRSYVLAHELTHALWGSMMGAKVSDMKVSNQRGSVTLSKTNFLVALAPYFFPLYTVVVIVAYYMLSVFFAVESYHIYWLALIGLSWGFHFTFTVSTLAQHQTDIRQYGHLFSYAVIYLLNILGIGLWVIIVSSATLEQFIEFLAEGSLVVALAVRQWIPALTPRIGQ